jgi:8-oxo-dGTP pyrophosphatase MutT (NUDIX family)
MIKKLRGMKGFSDAADVMAKDLYNLPGGKVLPGESFFDCALREIIEETGINPVAPQRAGQLQFEWPDLTIVCQVFKTEKWSGEISCDNDECIAQWVDLDKIPYDNMWADDLTWFPEILAGKIFHYKVLVTDERTIEMVPQPIEEIRKLKMQKLK